MGISIKKITVEIFQNNILIRNGNDEVLALYSAESEHLSFRKRHKSKIELKIAEIIIVNVHKFLQQNSKNL